MSELLSIAAETRDLELDARQRELDARERELDRRLRDLEAVAGGRRPRPPRILFGTIMPRLPVDHF